MGNINMIKDGSGIEFTAFINGWKEHFKLCIIRRKDWNKNLLSSTMTRQKLLTAFTRVARQDLGPMIVLSKTPQHGNW